MGRTAPTTDNPGSPHGFGFTLVELLIVITLLAVVVAAVIDLYSTIGGQWAHQVSRADAVATANTAVARMTPEIRAAIRYEALDLDGVSDVFTLPADTDVSGNYVPALASGVLAYQPGMRVRFYRSDATGNPAVVGGTILWRATSAAGSHVWVPDTAWSLQPGSATTGRVAGVTALTFASTTANIVRITLTTRGTENHETRDVTVAADVFLANGSVGTGLTAQFFNAPNPATILTDDPGQMTPVLTRLDPTIDFDWGTGSPATAVNSNYFLVRWSGQVLAPVTGTVTFSTVSDDGIRVSVNGRLIIQNWTAHRATTDTGTIQLTAGQRYDIVVEYFDNTGYTVARLLWSYPGQATQVVPQSALFPASVSGFGSALTVTQPTAPTGVTAHVSGNHATLTWTAPNSALGYRIYRGTTSGGQGATPVAVIGYSGASSTSFRDTGLLSGQRYYYQVSATNLYGEAPRSAEVIAAVPCAAPRFFTATNGVGAIGLTWENTPGATSYNLYRGTTSGGQGATPYQTGLTTPSFTDTSVTGNTTYYYQVTAVNASGESARSSEGSDFYSSVAFLTTDTSTQGSWQGVYGSAGAVVAQSSTSPPTGATDTIAGSGNQTWASSTSDVRGLQKIATPSSRIAACWYANTYFDIDIATTDASAHPVSFYCVDWDSNGPRQIRVDALDTATGAVLDSRSLTSFSNGVWLRYAVRGDITFRFTKTGGASAVVSGIFFD